MAKWSFQLKSWTPIGVADATNYTDNGYQGLMGGASATNVMAILEVYCGGQAGASSVNAMTLSRDVVVQGTPTALAANQTNAALHTATAALALPQVAFTASTTKPQRSSTLGLLNLSFNSFGGIVRWVAAPGEEIWMLGNVASFGEVSLGAINVGTPGLMGSHIIYEPY